MERKREQEARDRPIRRKKRSKRSRGPRVHAHAKERKNFVVTRLGSLNRVLNGKNALKSPYARTGSDDVREWSLSESNLKLYFGDLINPADYCPSSVVLYRAGMDERGRISAILNCQITATRRSLRTYLNPTWHEPGTRERVPVVAMNEGHIAGIEFSPRAILPCIPRIGVSYFSLCAECVSVRVLG